MISNINNKYNLLLYINYTIWIIIFIYTNGIFLYFHFEYFYFIF